jgi:hypothetical protein
MSATTIVIRKSKRVLRVYNKRGRLVFSTPVAHGKTGTTTGTRKIKKWVWGPVSHRPDYSPITWFSFGATFSKRYRWPKPGETGFVRPGHGRFKAKRLSTAEAKVEYDGVWYEVWKDSNPFGVLMADLSPGLIELHGTHRDKLGADELPSMSGGDITHGCVRVSNTAIRKIKQLAPIGTVVKIRP